MIPILTIGILGALCVALVLLLSHLSLDRHIERRAFSELELSVSMQSEALRQAVDQQYAPLESLAAYLGAREDARAAFLEMPDFYNALMLSNQLRTLGYADLAGNGVSFEGEDLGNIADSSCFRDATAWRGGVRSIEYVAEAPDADAPRILLCVPIRRNNVAVGVLFAAREISFFEDALPSNGFQGDLLTLVADNSGAVIAVGGGARARGIGAGILSSRDVNALDAAQVSEDMRNGASGSFRMSAGGDYVAYRPLGVKNWYAFGILPAQAIASRYGEDMATYRRYLSGFCLVFFIVLAGMALVARVYTRRIRRQCALERQRGEGYRAFLQGTRSVVFDYDIATQKIRASDAFERIFGYALPEDWPARFKERSAEHPEFDYQALAEAKSRVELEGEAAQVVLCARTRDQGLRWFRAVLTPQYNADGNLTDIYSVAVDVSEEQETHHRMLLERERMLLALNSLASLVISVNLTKNRYRVIKADDFAVRTVPKVGVLDELIEFVAFDVPESDRQRFVDAFSRERLLAAHARGEKRVELEHRQLGDDGAIRWMRTGVLFVDDTRDGDVYEITIARDVSESKRQEALLQRGCDLALDSMPCCVGKWLFSDGDVLLIDANRRYLDFMGVSAEQALGKSAVCGLGEAQRRDALAALYAHERLSQPISFTAQTQRAGGEGWVKVQAEYLETRDGCSVYFGAVTDITELIFKQDRLSGAVRELESANAQIISDNIYHNLINASRDGGVIVNSLWLDGPLRLLYISPGIMNLTGYTEAELRSYAENGCYDLLVSDDLEQIMRANRAHTAIGDHFGVEFCIRRKDGRQMWVMQHSQVVELPGGVAGVASLFTDISSQKQLERKLRISQKEYRIAATLSNLAVLSFDIRSKSYEVIAQSGNPLDFMRVSRDVPELAIREGAVAPESVDKARELFGAIARAETHEKVVLALISRNEKKYWMEVAYSLIYDDNGEAVTAILAFDDVTVRKQADALFNISSAFLDYAGNGAKLLVVDITSDLIGYETPGPHGMLAKLAGTANARQAMRYAVEHLVLAEDAQICAAYFSLERLRQMFESGTFEESFEYRGLAADGTPHWMNVQTRLMLDTYTQNLIAYIVFSDINAQKLAEMALLRKPQIDPLTGMLDRDSFEEELRLRASASDGRATGLLDAYIMIDIDHFGQINAALGRDAGDEALREAARRVGDKLRDGDLVARFGGDELIVMLPDMPSVDLINQRCAEICEGMRFSLSDGTSLSGSLGVAICPDDGDDSDTLVKKAADALSFAKSAGGNRCARYADAGAQPVAPERAGSKKNAHAKRIFARTFGYFDLFVDGKPLHFTNAKEKELLAILIDRNGGTLTSNEAISILWEDEPASDRQNTRYRRLAMNLKNTLHAAGIDYIVVSNRGVRNIDTSKLVCDYYQFLKGDPEFKALYHGAYMTNYSWSEQTIAILENRL